MEPGDVNSQETASPNQAQPIGRGSEGQHYGYKTD